MAELDRTVWTAPVRNLVWVACPVRAPIAPMPDRARPDHERDVLEHLRRARLRSLRRAREGGPRAGVAHLRPRRPGRHLRPDEVLGAATDGGPLPCGSTITVEPGGRWSWPRRPSTRGGARSRRCASTAPCVRQRLADAGHRPCWPPGIDPFREPGPHAQPAALRRHAGVLRRVGSGGAPDDVELRVDPGQHRLRRRRHAGPPLGPRPPHRPGAGGGLRLLAAPAPPLRAPGHLERDRPHPHQAGAGARDAGGGLERLRARRPAHAPARRRRQLRARWPCR